MTDTQVGLLVLGVPLLLIGAAFLKRWRGVLWMYIAALVVGLGYLTTTGAVQDVGKQAISYVPAAANHVAPEPTTPAAAPSSDAMAPTPPAAEPAPATEPPPAPSTQPAPAP